MYDVSGLSHCNVGLLEYSVIAGIKGMGGMGVLMYMFCRCLIHCDSWDYEMINVC